MPACPRAQSRHALTAAHADVREPKAASITEGNFKHSGHVTVSPNIRSPGHPGGTGRLGAYHPVMCD